jgi:hypothetical protein
MKFSRFLPAALLAAAATLAHAQTLVEEVPFITTPDNVTLEMLRIAGVGARDHVIDLGSGDGRIVITAAKRFGASGLGVEIVPELVERSLRSAREAGVADRVAFRVQDLFETDLAPATVITMYLLPEFNMKLRPAILNLRPGTRVVSHDWNMGDWKPDQTTVVSVPDKKVGIEKSSRIHYWMVPAKVDGLWCGVGFLRGSSLLVSQKFQEFGGTLKWLKKQRDVQGRLSGAAMHMTSGRHGAQLAVEGDELRVVQGTGQLALGQGQRFRRSAGPACEGGIR